MEEKKSSKLKEKGEAILTVIKEKTAGWNKKKIGIGCGIAAGVLVVCYVAFSLYFNSHFFFRSTVNGVAASGATAATVKERILKDADDYTLSIVEKDAEDETLSSSDVGLKVDVESGAIEELLGSQNGFAWIGALFSPKAYKNEDIVSFDQKKLAASVADLSCVTRTDAVETKDATCTYKDGEFVIVDEVYGTNVDVDDLTKYVSDAVTSLQDTLDLEKDKCYVQPDITATSKSLKTLVSDLNERVNMDFSYTVGSSTEKVDAKTLAGFLAVGEDQTIAYDDEAIAAFVSEMAKKYNTYGLPKTLATTSGTTVTVPGGNYGWKIDNDGEAEQIKADLAAGEDVSRDFVYEYEAASRGGNDYGNSYVEINLTAQTVYLYVNGSLVTSSKCVTGDLSKGAGTPTGAFRITYCQRDTKLSGGVGRNVNVPVSYWMPFYGNYGLHDATWRSSFGGTIYKTSGSNGCVNLPLSAASTIFSNAYAGFPVLIYTLGGTETASEVDEAKAAATTIDKINAIGDISLITLDSEAAIVDARATYEALTDGAKALVTNLSSLEAAEAQLAALHAQADAAAAQAAENEAARQASIAAEATRAIEAINAIGDPAAVSAANAGTVTNARSVFNSISAEAQSRVTNYGNLTKAEATLDAQGIAH